MSYLRIFIPHDQMGRILMFQSPIVRVLLIDVFTYYWYYGIYNVLIGGVPALQRIAIAFLKQIREAIETYCFR